MGEKVKIIIGGLFNRKNPGQASIAARLDRLPVSPFHYRLLVINGFAWAFDAFDVGLITFVVTALNKAWTLQRPKPG